MGRTERAAAISAPPSSGGRKTEFLFLAMERVVHLEYFLQSVKGRCPYVEALDPDQPLSRLGFTSLNIVELIVACSEAFPAFDFDNNFIFAEDATLRQILAAMSSSES
jgi:hypothetical protein